MDLERELRALEIAWPETPHFSVATPRHARWRRHATGWRRHTAVALAALAVAVAAAFAVPQSRAAILRFLDLGGVTIEFVDRLPAARERPLSADLGPVVTRAEAEAALGRPLLVPHLQPLPPLHLRNRVVSLVFAEHGEPVLLSEFAFGSFFFKKLVGGSTSVVPVVVHGDSGLWLSGAEHAVFFTTVPPRLAGNVLIWQDGDLTLRIEGRRLTEAQALDLADAIYPGMG